jgi:hypothetical protein
LGSTVAVIPTAAALEMVWAEPQAAPRETRAAIASQRIVLVAVRTTSSAVQIQTQGSLAG